MLTVRRGSQVEGGTGREPNSWWAWVLVTAWGVPLFFPTEASLRGGLGMPWVLLWLMLAAVACGRRWASLRSSGGEVVPIRWHGLDWAWLFYFSWYSLSVAVGLSAQTLEARPAIGLWWQLLGMVAIYLTARLSAGDRIATRLWPSAIVAFTLALAIFAGYQFAYLLPAMHEDYLAATESQKVARLLAAGVMETEPGSRMRELFESRLFNREPFGTFTLTNTLAIVLTPGVLLAFFSLVSAGMARRWWSAGGWFVAWVLISGSLATTSSRTALVSVVIVSGLWVAGQWRSRAGRTLAAEPDGPSERRATGGPPGWRWVWGGLGLLILLPILVVVGLWSLGASDARLWSSAPASVQYRLQYWVASSEMIAARPLFGWGPGNFQSAYARFQPVEASETVADPHNFFFELAATAGLPAGIAFLWAVGGAMVSCRRMDGCKSGEGQRDPANRGRGVNTRSWGPGLGIGLPFASLLIAMGIGLAIAWLGESVPQPIPVLVGCGLLAALWWAIQLRADADGGESSADLRDGVEKGAGNEAGNWLPWITVGLLLNLLAAGGVTYPAIAQSLALIAGWSVGLGQVPWKSEAATDRRRLIGAPAASVGCWGGLAAVWLGLAFYAYAWQTMPVIRSEWAVQRARDFAQWDNPVGSRRELQSAVQLDPLQAEAAIELAIRQLFDRLPDLERAEVWGQVQRSLQLAAARRPDSSPTRLRIAEAVLMAAAQADRSEALRGRLLTEAEAWLQAGLERKPVDSRLQAQLSWLAWVRQDIGAATSLARAATRLDERNPHADLRLERQWFSATAFDLPADYPHAIRPTGPFRGLVQINAQEWVQWILAGEVGEVTAK